MATTSKERVEAVRKRKDEYRHMRDALIRIALAYETSDADRIAAINTIYKIDSSDIPYPNL
jgi:hypothetical protein